MLPWEARLIRRLSASYAGERQLAEDRKRVAPYTGLRDEIIANRDRVAGQIRAAFGQLKKKE